jgi:cytochrome d ubiquinol oxidase subunit I
MFSRAMWTATLVAPRQLVIGDPHGIITYEHQPAQVTAISM